MPLLSPVLLNEPLDVLPPSDFLLLSSWRDGTGPEGGTGRPPCYYTHAAEYKVYKVRVFYLWHDRASSTTSSGPKSKESPASGGSRSIYISRRSFLRSFGLLLYISPFLVSSLTSPLYSSFFRRPGRIVVGLSAIDERASLPLKKRREKQKNREKI